jgi:hypothetical protein
MRDRGAIGLRPQNVDTMRASETHRGGIPYVPIVAIFLLDSRGSFADPHTREECHMSAHFRAITVGALSAMLVGSATAGGLSGAIYTTNHDGSFVNGNVYDALESVYLNGGPRANQKCSAAGLPDGEYYFQVTDPPGKVLLTTDPPAERKVLVENGLIVAYLGSARLTGEGQCSDPPMVIDVTVQLFPLGATPSTPNPGGEYKVWLTPASRFECCGFIPSYSKTDNFKVEPPEGGGEPD